jgi:DNA-binding CsgD family transcriptional regulator
MVWSDMENSMDAVTKTEMRQLLDLMHDSLSCNNEGDFSSLIERFRNLVEFDHLLCAYGDLKGSMEREEGLDHSALLHFTYPEEWLNRYLNNDYLSIDNVAKAYFSTFRLQSWRDARNRFSSGKRTLIEKEATCFGVSEGYIYGTRAMDMENLTSFAFSGAKMAYTRRTELLIGYAVPHLSECLIRIMSGRRKKHFSLTVREREVLTWLKEGKTGWEVSVILNISHRTVSFHVNNLMRKLNAVNSCQAVAIAMENGMI